MAAGKKLEPYEFELDLCVGPIRLLLSDTGFGEISGEQAHFERQEEALLSVHCAPNLQLDDPRRGTCVSEGHAQ